MHKIFIKKNINGDTRTAQGEVDFKTFSKSNDMHRIDVNNIMNELASEIYKAGLNHDFTKKYYEIDFYKDFVKSRVFNTKFTESEWYQLHIKRERHHLLQHCPADVNLIDILEMISDCIAAGLSRSGSYKPLELPHELLQLAIENTEKLILDHIEVVE